MDMHFYTYLYISNLKLYIFCTRSTALESFNGYSTVEAAVFEFEV